MSEINEQRVLELIQSYGADLKRWPEAERQDGKAWLEAHPDTAQALLVNAQNLDQWLDTGRKPVGGTDLLQARILKMAQGIPQDSDRLSLARPVANDSGPVIAGKNRLSSWKSVAATLLLTTGIGFGVGQVAAADASYETAEALLSISMQSGYEEADLTASYNGDG